jgi:hypothetical protein
VKLLLRDNDELAQRLEVQQREYLKIVEETRDNADIMIMRGGASTHGDPKGTLEGGNRGDEAN